MKGRIMSGMRPTGRLQLGNLVGALDNWVRLQHEYECFFAVVDWHALTTGYEDTKALRDNIREMVLDWLAAGLDPGKCTIFVQSDVKEHAELHLLLSMVTPLGWLERCPTYKDQLRELEGRDIATYGFLGYPVLQAADILAYRATVVPVGEDQLPHLELAREIARRFNFLYGAEVFPEPQARMNQIKLLPGTDGRKMSKSYGNTINMAADPDEVRTAVMGMVTDPQRARRNDPGDPEVCTLFKFQTVFNAARGPEIAQDCRAAQIGCVQCKKELSERLLAFLGPIHERRRVFADQPERVEDILHRGGEKARAVAAETLKQVRLAMNLR